MLFLSTHKKIVTVSFSLIACLLIGFIAGNKTFAASLGNFITDNQIRTCVNNSSGTPKFIHDNETCNSNETLITWTQNQSGGSNNNGMPVMCESCTLTNRFLGNLFIGKDLSNGFFQGTNFEDSNLSNTNFTSATLYSAGFLHTNLTNTNFTNAILDQARIETDLRTVNFNNASLIGTIFVNSNMTNQNLSGIDLSNAIFDGSNLTGANLTNTTRTGIIWSNTICPDGTNSNSNGNTCEGHL